MRRCCEVGFGVPEARALNRAAQAILGRRAPDGRPAGNLGWTGAGWLLCGGEETGERARAVSESSGRWQVGRRGSADARAEGGGRFVRGAARTWALASGVTRGRADVWAQAVSRGGERVRAERGAGLVEALRSGPDRAEVRASGPGLRFGPECCAGKGRNGPQERERETWDARERAGPRKESGRAGFGLG